jgi:NADH:ubiquinone oxidoreductase subunit C
VFFTDVKDSDTIPSITSIIPSAIVSQREIVDMFGIKVEDSESGFYLDEDSLQKPLSFGCAL